MRFRCCSHLALLLWPLMALAQAAPPAAAADLIVNSFESAAPTAAPKAANLKAVPGSDGPAEGKNYLQLFPSEPEANRAQLKLELPAKSSPAGHARFTAAMRAPKARETVQVRWYALDDASRILFQRRVDLAPGEKWVRLDEPLRHWRWDNRRVGDWDEVRSLALVISTPDVQRIDLDDVRFTGSADEKQNVAWLLDVAFGDRPRKSAHADGLLVATDAVDAFQQKDLLALLDQMRRTRAWVRATFGEAARPTDDHDAPATLLIFRDPADYPAFYQRLGAAWRVGIQPPRAQGYTVQDIATSTYDPAQGTRRPVYLHEGVHAVVARELRLLTGHRPHMPLQEGIANYLQICLYPTSLPRASYVQNFVAALDPDGQSFFKPLETLFTEPVTTRHYAQLASVVAFLVEENPRLLRDLARGLADGASATEILQRNGTTWQWLQDKWLAWGMVRFAPVASGDPNQPAFETPAEFKW